MAKFVLKGTGTPTGQKVKFVTPKPSKWGKSKGEDFFSFPTVSV